MITDVTPDTASTCRFEARFLYTADLARRACLQWMWHEQSGWLVGFAIAFAISVAAMLSASYRIPGVFIAGFSCFFFVGAVQRWASAGVSGGEREGPVTVRFFEGGVRVLTEYGQAAAPWLAYSQVFVTRGFLFLDGNRRQPFILPRSAVSGEACEFARVQVEAARREFETGLPRA